MELTAAGLFSIAGVDLPRDKRVEIGLTYIYGIGKTSAIRILADAGVDPDTRVGEKRNLRQRCHARIFTLRRFARNRSYTGTDAQYGGQLLLPYRLAAQSFVHAKIRNHAQYHGLCP